MCLIANITLQLKFFSPHFIEPKIHYSYYSEVVKRVRIVKEFEKEFCDLEEITIVLVILVLVETTPRWSSL